MLIIAGHLKVDPAQRDRILTDQIEVVATASTAPGCLDFAITADTADLGRIRIYERWENDADLLSFRASGPTREQQHDIIAAEVARYEIASVGEP